MADDFAAEDFSTVVFDEYLCVGLPQENVTRHLIRLVYNVYHKLCSSRLDSIIKTLQPASMQSEPLRESYSALEEKINGSMDMETEVDSDPSTRSDSEHHQPSSHSNSNISPSHAWLWKLSTDNCFHLAIYLITYILRLDFMP